MTIVSEHHSDITSAVDDETVIFYNHLIFAAFGSKGPGLYVTVKQEEANALSVTESTIVIPADKLASVMTPVIDWVASQLPGGAPEAFIELTPPQSVALNQAWFYEQTRLRHEEEEWSGGTERDVKNRDEQIAHAVVLGVPEAQAKKFVFTPVSETESDTPEEE